MHLRALHRDVDREHDRDLESEPASGGRERLARRRSAVHADTGAAGWTPSTARAVQRFAAAVNAGVHDVHAVAASGFAGAGAAPPHLAEVQRAFGRHDVSNVRAYVGGAAHEASEALGARAYASGNQVAFASEPDLFLVAHELAHVVQQRGGVQLSGGVGADGDEHEVHANTVASVVVRGESAEALLDRYGGAGGGERVQYDRGPRRHATPRRARGTAVAELPPAEIDRVIEDTVQAIAGNEVGGAPVAPQSRMGTASGVPASYGSATQMVTTHALGVLRGAGGEVAAEHGVDEDELSQADKLRSATGQIWDLLVVDQQPISAIRPALRRRVPLTDAQLEQMVAFGRVRQRMLAEQPGFAARTAAVQQALERRADAARARLDQLAAGDDAAIVAPGDDTATATEPGPLEVLNGDTAVGATGSDAVDAVSGGDPPAVDEAALGAALETHALRALGPLAGVERPDGWSRWPAARRQRWLAGQRRLLDTARGRIADLSARTAASMLASELATDPDVVQLHLSQADLRGYIHDGQFHRFLEDRASWARAAMQMTPETHPDGDMSRSLDTTLAGAIEAGGGWTLSRAEYDRFIRDYIAAHPRADEQEVVRAAASHNGHSPGYPDRIWRNYQRIHQPGDGPMCDGDATFTPGSAATTRRSGR